MSLSNVAWSSVRKPSCGRPSERFDLSRTRMTIDSPWFVGTELTRRSRSLPPTDIWMRPSCGMRFSDIFIFDMILTREMIACWSRFGGESILRRAPSIRYLTRNSFSIGSRWISDAFILMAVVMIIVASLITGASSPVASSPASPSSSRVWTSASASAAYSLTIAALTSALGEITASTSRPCRT